MEKIYNIYRKYLHFTANVNAVIPVFCVYETDHMMKICQATLTSIFVLVGGTPPNTEIRHTVHKLL